jgi:hypothetical protein
MPLHYYPNTSENERTSIRGKMREERNLFGFLFSSIMSSSSSRTARCCYRCCRAQVNYFFWFAGSILLRWWSASNFGSTLRFLKSPPFCFGQFRFLWWNHKIRLFLFWFCCCRCRRHDRGAVSDSVNQQGREGSDEPFFSIIVYHIQAHHQGKGSSSSGPSHHRDESH